MTVRHQFAQLIAVLCLSMISVAFSASSGAAETYLAGQFGVTFPNSLSHVNFVSPLSPGPDFDLKTSLAYGGKLGHYFEELQWLGVEAEIFRTNPVISQQGAEPGASLSVTTLAMAIVARYQAGRWEPYAGVGPGIFFSRVKSASPVSRFDEAQSTSIGLNTQVGLRFFVTGRVALFTEWKYNHSRISFDSLPNANYNAHHWMFGVAYHLR
jgi:opacity protein-like surface antigen